MNVAKLMIESYHKMLQDNKYHATFCQFSWLSSYQTVGTFFFNFLLQETIIRKKIKGLKIFSYFGTEGK